MSIELLLKLIPPPDNPRNIPKSAEWGKITEILGSDLPTDYKIIIERYGSGVFGTDIVLNNPFSTNQNIHLIKVQNFYSSHMKKFRDEFDDCKNLLIFPEKGGLLSLGRTTDGETLFWQTAENPDDWTITVWDGLDVLFENHNMNISGFLVSLEQECLKSSVVRYDAYKPNQAFFSYGEDQ